MIPRPEACADAQQRSGGGRKRRLNAVAALQAHPPIGVATRHNLDICQQMSRISRVLSSQRALVLRMGRRGAVFTAAEARASGVHTSVLTRLAREGVIERVARGQYRIAGGEVTQHHALVLAAAAVPDGVVCLLSALSFHGIGTQLPSEVWIARGRRTWEPRIAYPQLRIVRFSGEALTAGIETHRLEGRSVRMYCVAKTVVDCFKFRNKIGLDVVLEALTDGWRNRRFRIAEIEHYAKICRVQNVIRPYLEALVA